MLQVFTQQLVLAKHFWIKGKRQKSSGKSLHGQQLLRQGFVGK